MKNKPDVPLSLAPEGVSKFRKMDIETLKPIADTALDTLEGALAFAQQRARELSDICDAVSADPTQTAGAGAARIRNAALQIGEKAAAKLDAARASLEREIEAIGKSTSAPPPPKDQVQHQLEGEVRAAFARMSAADRKKAWTAALTAGDVITIGGVLRAPGYLSGHGDAELELKRHSWRSKTFPAEVDREDRLRRALQAAERAGQSLVKFIEGVADGPGGEAEAAARHAKEMLAAAADAAE